jgi:predicted RNase H-like HicB family nuclease
MQTYIPQVGYDPQTKQYIAEIPSLNLSDFGDTPQQAQNNLFHALALLVEERQEVPESALTQ